MLRILAVLPAIVVAGVASAVPARVTLLHVNDTHSHLSSYGVKDTALDGTIGGLARAASIIGAEKAANPSALFVHAGDLMHGDVFFNEYLGVPELLWLESLGLDAMVLGNHEFDLGPDFLTAVLATAWPAGGNFPILSTNLDLTGYPVLSNWVTTDASLIKDVGGVRVGFFGLTTPFVLNAMPAPAVLRTELADISAAAVQSLRAQGADVVVALAHVGIELSRELAAGVPGIDVVISGHDHVILEDPELIPRTGGGTAILVCAGSFYSAVGKLELDVEGGAVALAGYQLFEIDRNVPLLPPIAAQIEALRSGIVARYGDIYHRPLALAFGTIPNLYDPARRERDTPIGNLWTDAYRDKSGTDIAVEVNGYLDEPLPSGFVVGADVFRVHSGGLPEIDMIAGTLRVPSFRLATFELTGAELVQALEAVLAIGGDVFPQVSGLRFAYDSTRPPGQQILAASIRVNHHKLRPTQLYTLTSSEVVLMFLPNFGIQPRNPQLLEATVFETVKDFIRRHNFLFRWPEGRIKDAGGACPR